MAQVISYIDPVEDFPGWLVYDATDCRIAAGGCRVQPGLTADLLASLAGRMTLKERLLGINVDGAKCGIDYDPSSPGKAAALGRFLAFLRTELNDRFSMGCDMGTQWGELERLAAGQGIPSIKYAVRHAQQFTDDEYFARIRLLDAPAGPLSLGQRRAGHALAHAAIEAAQQIDAGRSPTCLLQGFGNLGRAAACTLAANGIRITGIADEHGSVFTGRGFDIPAMLAEPQGRPVRSLRPDLPALPPEALFDRTADMVVLAAGQNAMSPAQAAALQAPLVVVGANCGLEPEVELLLHRRGVLVVPDVVGGIGGSASMEALFGSARCPDPGRVLGLVAEIMHGLIGELVTVAARRHEPLRTAALHLAATARVEAGDRPYGGSPYLTTSPTPRLRAS